MAVFLQEREELEFPEKGADLTRINCKFLNKHLETKWGLKVGLPGRSGVILLLSKAMPGGGFQPSLLPVRHAHVAHAHHSTGRET